MTSPSAEEPTRGCVVCLPARDFEPCGKPVVAVDEVGEGFCEEHARSLQNQRCELQAVLM